MKQKKKTKEIPYFIKTKLKKSAKYYLVLDFCKAVSGKYCLLSRMSQKVYVEQVAKIRGHWWGNMIYLYFVTVQNNPCLDRARCSPLSSAVPSEEYLWSPFPQLASQKPTQSSTSPHQSSHWNRELDGGGEGRNSLFVYV